MDRALFLAMSGAKQNMQALQLRANNLANVSTTGFRADLAQARSMQAYGEGMPTRVFSMTEENIFLNARLNACSDANPISIAISNEIGRASCRERC